MKTKTLSSAQLNELQTCIQRINNILGLSLSIADDHSFVVRRSSYCVRKSVRRTTPATFVYRWYPTAPQRVAVLYQHLLRAHWIAPDTAPDDFAAIFSGETSMAQIKWTAPKSYLVCLVRLLTDRQYLSIPKGMGRWMIVSSHFVDAHRRELTNLNSQRIPHKALPAIERLAELLNAAAG